MKKINKLRIPVTHGLKDMYAMDMRLAYQAAYLGHLMLWLLHVWQRLFSVIRLRSSITRPKIPHAIETLDEAIVTLQAVRKKGDEADIWK